MTTDTDDLLAASFEHLRDATPPPAAYDAVRRAQHHAPAERATSSRRRRPAARTLALLVAGLAVAGTATAAVTSSGPFSGLDGSATSDAPAARTLGVLLHALDDLASQSGAPAGATAPERALAGSGTVRGTTVTRDGISVDIALDDTRICLGTAGPRTPSARGGARADTERSLPPLTEVPRATDPPAVACFSRSASDVSLPSISGRDAGRVWLTAVVPDDVRDLSVTADGGRTATPSVQDNVAIASIPGADRLETLSWTAPTGRRVSQDLSVTPGSATPTVRRLDVK
ncbi:hypothetical protein AB0L40_04045 [Patulibacter sp. NPDC049589]|uniref:hypothetical protein n=1 Tax=Patulibacter sp. NPDC049589 TaxID=3154731 RepID=UPI00341A3A30